MAKKNVRNYGRKALSLLLTLVMLVSTMQLTAFAAAGDEIPADHTDHVWHQGEPVAENGVTIQKTAEDLGNDLFEITLQVTIPEDVEVTNYDPVRVVMVIDSSNSMTNFGVQRLANAKAAAKTLVDALLTEEGVKAGNQVAVATYNKTARTVSEFTNDLAGLKSDIDAISSSQGTNVQAGLKEARDILAADRGFEGRQIVIVLSDGEPSYSEMAVGAADWTGCNHSDKRNNNKTIENLEFTGFAYGTLSSGLNGTSASHVTATCPECGQTTEVSVTDNRRFMADHAAAAVYEAGLLKNTDVTVYSVFVGDDGNDTTTSMMNSIASDLSKSISVSDEDLASLAELFETIAIDVTSQVTTAGTVDDPMGDYVTVEEAADESIDVVSDSKLIWNVTDATPVVNDDGSKTYTVSYTVTLNTHERGFQSRVAYPANDTTTFTYWKDGTKYEMDFDVPEIWGENAPVDLSVAKVWDKDGKYVIQPTSATVQLLKDGEPEGEPVELNDENGWSCQWTELDGDFEWTVEEINIPADWEVSYETEGETVTITNLYTGEDQTPPAELTVVKVWENVLEGVELPGSITYTVNGQEFTMTANDATESGEWVDVIEVKKADEYIIEETNVGEEWDVSVDGLTITNTYANVGSLKIIKTSNDEALIPAETLFTITGSMGYSTEVSYSEFTDGVYELNNLVPDTYTVVESGAGVEGYTLDVTGNNQSLEVSRGGTAEFEITNTYTVIPPDTGSLKIIKQSNLLNLVPADTLFTIEGPEGYSAEVAYSEFNNGNEHIINGLEVGTYTVTESGAEVDEYELDVVGSGDEAVITKDATAEITITNTYVAEVGSLTITKAVYGLEENAVMPADTAFQLLQGNTVVKTVTWGEFENGSITVNDLPVGSYTVNEEGGLVEGYSGPALHKIYDGDGANEAAAVTIGGTGTVEITNTYKKIETAFFYNVIHEFYTSTNDGEYLKDGRGEPVQHGPVEMAPGNAAVFGAESRTDSYDGAVYARLNEYADGEVIRSGDLQAKTLTYVVKYYRTDWTEGSLTITKKIEGLDQRTERTLKGQLEFRVTGPEGYDETFSFGEDFNSKGVLTLEKLEPGTYTIEEMGAEVGDGYKLDVRADDADEDEDGYQVEVKAGKRAAAFHIRNNYVGRVYNIWFDGGSHGKVQNSNYITVEGLWRSHWHNYQQDMSDPFGDDYDWASSLRTTGKTVYGYGSGTLYPDLNEDPEIIEDTNMVLYTITAAQWAEHSRKMYIDEPALETEDGWTSNEVYYVIGTDIAFTGIGDAIEYMNDNVSPDGNGFYNVHYRPQYESEPDDTPENPYIPSGPSGDPDPNPQPEIEIPEEEVPLAELPEEEVPLADIPEEEVPLSDVPKTGDDMLLYAMLAAVSGLGLGYLALTGKKREEEAAE